MGSPGSTVQVALNFQEGPDDHQPGGIDATAAIALTLHLGTGVDTPLVLADCTLDENGLPKSIHPDPAIADFNLVVENAACTASQTDCLCPNAITGITPDNFINLVIFGPNPVPTPGSGVLSIPILPNGQLLTLDLKIGATASGTIPLHVLTYWTDSQHPADTAFLSIGDPLGVDQTCIPIKGVPPCAGTGRVSQVLVTDGSIVVPATPTPTRTNTATQTATRSPTNTPTVTPSRTATVTATQTPTATPTVTRSATSAATATATMTATRTTTSTATRAPTQPPSATATSTATSTATRTATGTPTNTITPPTTPSQTPSKTPQETGTATETAAATATDTATAVPTRSLVVSTPTPVGCVGDCDATGSVEVSEIITLVNIALGNQDVSSCPYGIPTGEDVSITLVIQAVNNALNGCQAVGATAVHSQSRTAG